MAACEHVALRTGCVAKTKAPEFLISKTMEEWGFVVDRELQGWKGGVVFMTCQHFLYGVDQHCRTRVGCNLRQKQQQQGEHQSMRCKLWAPTTQAAMGWAP